MNTKYYCRAYARVNDGYSSKMLYGNIVSFVTGAAAFTSNIEFSREAYNHPGNSNCNNSLDFVFDDGRYWHIAYKHLDYDGLHGIYVEAYDKNGNLLESERVFDMIDDTWFVEKAVVNYDGNFEYYIGDSLVGSIYSEKMTLSHNTYVYSRITSSGWYSGHYQLSKKFSLACGARSLYDDFSEPTLNPEIWDAPEEEAETIIENGVLKVASINRDNPGILYTNRLYFGVDPEISNPTPEDIVIRRDYFLHAGNSNTDMSFDVVISDGRTWDIRYQGLSNDGVHGIYLYAKDANGEVIGKHKLWYATFEEWVNEKIVVSKDGRLAYYRNGKKVDVVSFDEMKLRNDASFAVKIVSSGWYSGHTQLTKNFSVKYASKIVSDTFEEEELNPEIWDAPEEEAETVIEDGVLKVASINTDNPGVLQTNLMYLGIEPEVANPITEDIVIRRDYDQIFGNSNCDNAFEIVFDDGRTWSIRYDRLSNDGRHGIYLYAKDAEGNVMDTHKLWYANFDRWMNEKIILSKDGRLTYYREGKRVDIVHVAGMEFDDSNSFFTRIVANGWYSGHIQLVDNFSISVGNRAVIDTFSDAELNPEIWDAPEEEAETVIEDGVLKVASINTNNPGVLQTNLMYLGIEPEVANPITEDIVIRRDYDQIFGNSNCDNAFEIVFDDGRTWSIRYDRLSNDGRHGIYLYAKDAEGNVMDTHKLWYANFDRWMNEKIILSKDGRLTYYREGKRVDIVHVAGMEFDDSNSFFTRIVANGWYSGHSQQVDNFSVTVKKRTVINDTFSDAELNPEIWDAPEEEAEVSIENGVLKVSSISRDNPGVLQTNLIYLGVDPEKANPTPNDLVIERKYSVHAGNSNMDSSIDILFNDGTTWSVRYDHLSNDGRYGIYVYAKKDGKDVYSHKLWPLKMDQWMREKIVISKDGRLAYYQNGKKVDVVYVSEMKHSDGDYFEVNVTAGGWYSSHSHLTDDFSIKTRTTNVFDNFSDEELDTSIWQEPQRAADCVISGGVLKVASTERDVRGYAKTVEFSL